MVEFPLSCGGALGPEPSSQISAVADLGVTKGSKQDGIQVPKKERALEFKVIAVVDLHDLFKALSRFSRLTLLYA